MDGPIEVALVGAASEHGAALIALLDAHIAQTHFA
jgi:hypothetical protein